MTTRFRLRVQLPDRPGALASLAAALAGAGANVVSLDIHDLDGSSAVDDIVVVLDGGTPEDLAAHLAASDTAELLSWRLESGTTDAVVRALGWARAVLEGGIGYDDLEVSRALTEACSADAAWLATADEVAAADGLRSVLGAGRASVTHHEVLPAALGGDGSRSGWVLAAPDDATAPSLVALAARSDHRFTATEVARAEALLRLHVTLQPAARPTAG